MTNLEKKASSIPPQILVTSAFAAGAITAIGVSRIYSRYFKRIQNSDWITPESFQKKRWIKGIVTRCELKPFKCCNICVIYHVTV